MIKNKHLAFIIVILAVFASCKEEEAVPSYLHLTEWSFEAKPGEGTSNQLIKSAHVFVDGESIGVYQVPNTIPIVGEGNTLISVLPMIKQNGLQDVDVIFPYFEPLDTQLTLLPLQEDTLHLTTEYRDFTDFVIIEDFENRIVFSNDIDGDTGTKIERSNVDVYEGDFSGLILLNEENQAIEAGYDTLLTNTTGHGFYWVELNYKTNMIFVIGVQSFINGVSEKDYRAGINPKDEWNKIYFNLTDMYTRESSGLYQLVIVGLWTEDLDIEEGMIQIDNVKLLRTK